MTKVIEIAVSENFKGKMKSINSAKAVAGKGLIGDRHFIENNVKKSQVTLIEIENINHYNQLYNTFILAKDFRRNIITENIKLNGLVGKDFFIGEVKIRAHDLCRPCKYLQETLEQKDIIREFLQKGGLRCEILTSGIVKVGDAIKIL